MDPMLSWTLLAAPLLGVAALLAARERMRERQVDRSLRARLHALAAPAVEIALPDPAIEPLPWPKPPRTHFGRRPPHVLPPGFGGRSVLDGYAERLHA